MSEPKEPEAEEYYRMFDTLDEPLRSICRLEYLKAKITLADPVSDKLRERFDEARENVRNQGLDPSQVTKP